MKKMPYEVVVGLYKSLTARNEHTEALLLLANQYGTKELVSAFNSIKSLIDLFGHLNEDLKVIRDMLVDQLYTCAYDNGHNDTVLGMIGGNWYIKMLEDKARLHERVQ